MPGHRSLLVVVCFAVTSALAACGGGPSDPSPIAADAVLVPSNAVGRLTVQVDQICGGQESQISVFVDLQPIGTINPGEAGVSKMVTVGEHKLTAISQRGTQWGPYATIVMPAGQLERLGCLPPQLPPDAI